LEEFESGTPITVEIREVLRMFLSLDDPKKSELERLFEQIRQSYGKMLDSVKRRRSVTSKLDKLYRCFHEFSLNEGFDLCCCCERKLEMKVPEILWQLVLEKEFINYLNTHLKDHGTPENQPSVNTFKGDTRVLTDIEKNAVRYTAGFVIHKLQERYKKVKTKEGKECLAALHNIGSKMKSSELGEQEHCSSRWIKIVNRGGLCFVEDAVYDFFVTIEIIVDAKLSEILHHSGKGIELVNKENLSWVCKDEDVQCVWSSISSSIEEDLASQTLLKDIVHMWVTIRGNSKTRQIKEEMKSSQKKTVKGSRSLRKELESQ